MGLALVLAFAAPARAQSGERIESYGVTLEVLPSGRMHVTETIVYDFGAAPRHGIERTIPSRFHYDSRYDREYPISHVDVTASNGTPTDTKVSRGSTVVIRVGDPSRTITGVHRYVIQYDVAGAINRFEDHDELYWNAVGTEWDVPIGHATAQVIAQGKTGQVACFAGPEGSHSHCDSAIAGSGRATFLQESLRPYSGLTVVVSLPHGYVAAPGPILRERWSAGRAFARSPAALTLAALLLLLGFGTVLWLLSRKARDRTFEGEIPGLEPPAGVTPVEGKAPVFGSRAGPVEWKPDADMRPASMGVLLDERADPLDVTATIVDLAVRKWLTIEELPRHGLFHRRDWVLRRVPDAVDDGMNQWERTLYTALFPLSDEVRVSSLKKTFHPSLVQVQALLYADVVKRGWFSRSPDSDRTTWQAVAVAMLVVGGALTFVLARWTRLGLVGIPVVLTALLLLAVHRRMPFRTARGSAALARALGFKRYLATAEAEQLRAEEREGVFARYLPYAIVLGETERWAKVFGDLGADVRQQSLYWYSGPQGWSSMDFAHSFGDFATSTSGTLAATPSSSGSSGFGGGGFSGGGGGGGGGGSW
jgi:uncharacterized membrane protein YgcG